jgi:hypothetical protein
MSPSIYSMGAMIGYETISKKGFTFDIFMGPYYFLANVGYSVSQGIVSIPLGGIPFQFFWIRSGIAFGYTF